MSFNDFWTNKNNPALKQAEYLYNTRHIIVLVITVLLCVILTLIFKRKNKTLQQKLFYVFGGIFLFFEILSRVVNLVIEENLNLENILKIILPMHICSVMVWIFIIAIFSKNQTLINFSVVGGILATFIFLAYPAVGLNRVYMSFTCIYSTVSHLLGFVCCVLLMILGFVNFKIKECWKIYLSFIIMFLWGAILNFIMFPGSDYMYMVNDPLELSLNFPYQLLYGAIIIVYIITYYIISLLINRIKVKKEAKNV